MQTAPIPADSLLLETLQLSPAFNSKVKHTNFLPRYVLVLKTKLFVTDDWLSNYEMQASLTYKGASRLIVLVCLHKCGQFHEPEPKQRDQPEPWAPAVRYGVSRTVCTHRATVTPSLCSTSPTERSAGAMGSSGSLQCQYNCLYTPDNSHPESLQHEP
jgi:hypothetical protein